jgi:hypothetical protein
MGGDEPGLSTMALTLWPASTVRPLAMEKHLKPLSKDQKSEITKENKQISSLYRLKNPDLNILRHEFLR